MNSEFKRTTYIALFMILGSLLLQMLHTVLLSVYAKLLLGNWYLWSFGYTWNMLNPFLEYVRMFFTAIGLTLGYFLGRYFWSRVYDEHGNVRKRM